jgi:hypothetical protein
MNLVELSLILTPITGCIAGASAGNALGIFAAVLGGCSGLMIGAAMFAAAFILGAATFEVAVKEPSDEPPLLEWWVGMFFLLSVGAAPFAAYFVTLQSVSWMLRGLV